MKNPRITLVIITYNRAHLVCRSIRSGLNQTYQDFEIVVVNNGSTDNTAEVLTQYEGHEKIRIFHLDKNIGELRGTNYGFDQIRGEWFCLLGDDDEIVPEAFEIMFSVVDEIDTTIDAVTCNAIDTSTGKFSGFGLSKDQYLPVNVVVSQTSGNFWGITKTSLLGDKRFNPLLPGEDSTLWFKIDTIANRYYIHKALKIWYTDHGPTISIAQRKIKLNQLASKYRNLLGEKLYWELLKDYNKKQFAGRCIRAMIALKTELDNENLRVYKEMLLSARPGPKYLILAALITVFPAWILNNMVELARQNKLAATGLRLFFKRYSHITNSD